MKQKHKKYYITPLYIVLLSLYTMVMFAQDE